MEYRSVGVIGTMQRSINPFLPFLHKPSLSWMMFSVNLFEPRAVDMSIDLCGRYIGVP